MKKKGLTLLIVLLMLFSGPIYASTLNAHAASSSPVTITGPSKVAVNSSFNYTVSVENLFSNYTVMLLMSGYNLTGGYPVSPTYLTEIGAPAVFTLNAPSIPTTVFLDIQVRAFMHNRPYVYNNTVQVSVLSYTNLTVKINNPTNFKMVGVNVTFSVNGKYVGNQVINLSAKATTNVSYNWVSGKLSTGIYTVSVSISNKLVQVEGGNTYTFKIQSGNPYMIYIYIGIIAFFAIIFLVMIIASYYTRKKRPKWKRR